MPRQEQPQELSATSRRLDPLLAIWAGLGVGHLFLLLASGAILAWRISTSENHWAIDCRWLWVLSGAAIGWCGIGVMSRRAPKSLPVCMLVGAVLLAGLVFLADHYNLLVEYERWVGRGMPARWTTAG